MTTSPTLLEQWRVVVIVTGYTLFVTSQRCLLRHMFVASHGPVVVLSQQSYLKLLFTVRVFWVLLGLFWVLLGLRPPGNL